MDTITVSRSGNRAFTSEQRAKDYLNPRHRWREKNAERGSNRMEAKFCGLTPRTAGNDQGLLGDKAQIASSFQSATAFDCMVEE